MIKIGVTGGIGSGKTTVCKLIEKLGYPVYYADDRAKWIMNNDETCKKNIVSEFGSQSYNEKGLNKEYLAKTVFSNQNKIENLNSIVHPLVAKDFENWVKNQNSKYIFKEAALMFETDSWKQLDKIILVSAPENERIERVLKRDPQRDRQQVLDIISKQMPEEEKANLSNFTIQNIDIETIPFQVKQILTLIENES